MFKALSVSDAILKGKSFGESLQKDLKINIIVRVERYNHYT